MNILVVGGCGYVGGSVINILKEKKKKFINYDNLLYEDYYLEENNFQFGDVRDQKLLKKKLQWADSVIWLAAIVGDQACGINISSTNQINYESIKFLAKNFKKKIIFISTCSVYGEQNNIMLSENSNVNPLSLYAKTKLDSEKILSDSNAIIFRLGTLFGKSHGSSRIRLDLVVNVMTANAFFNKKISVYGGTQFRPLLHVKDAANIIVKCLNSKKTGIYNLHTTNIKIIDIAKNIKDIFPSTKIEIIKTNIKDTRNYKVSSQKAKVMLNFSPKYTVKNGIIELKKVFEEKRIKNLNLPKFSNFLYLNNDINKLKY